MFGGILELSAFSKLYLWILYIDHSVGYESQPGSILILDVKQNQLKYLRTPLVAQLQNTLSSYAEYALCVGLIAFYPMGQPTSFCY